MEQGFSLRTANIVANLTLGEIDTCYWDIHHSDRSQREFCDFLENIQLSFKANTTETQSAVLEAAYVAHASICANVQRGKKRRNRLSTFIAPGSAKQEKEALDDLYLVLEQLPTKALLLPEITTTPQDEQDAPDFMTSDHTLADLLEPETEYPFLVLQPKMSIRHIAMRNVFPYMEDALRNTDLWPAVLFWNNDEYIFIPVEDKNHLDQLFEIVRKNENPLPVLRLAGESDWDRGGRGFCPTDKMWKKPQTDEFVADEEETSGTGAPSPSVVAEGAAAVAETTAEAAVEDVTHYLFHISDLHFGMLFGKVHSTRLKALIRDQLANLDKENATFTFVITGDSINTPKKRQEKSYLEFSDFLSKISGENPIRVLGNHDVFNYGLAPIWSRVSTSRKKQPFQKLAASFPYLSEMENARVVELKNEAIACFGDKKPLLLLFNSNTGGTLAQGRIGQAQLDDMDRQLRERGDLDKYLLIAVMHHHLLPFPDLDDDIRDFYENVFPGFSLAGMALTESTMILEDTARFFNWLLERKVRMLLHGHKHMPFHTKIGNLSVIACGSSTGVWQKLINYNLIKLSNDSASFSLYFEDGKKQGIKNVLAVPIER